MSSFQGKGRGDPKREPLGGYEPISVTQLASVWWAYREGLISKLALRAYFGCVELEVRRRLSGGKYRPTAEGLRRLVGGEGAGEGTRPAVKQLLELGLLRTCSKDGITFAESADSLRVADRSGLDAMLSELQGITRKVPVPRRMIRRLAGGLSRTRTAVVIAHLIRCLFYRKGEGINPVGCCKASWIARVFGITERSVYDARSYLVEELGWLAPRESTQRVLNRDGLWVTVNLAWGPEESEEEDAEQRPAADGFSGPPAAIPARSSGPRDENKKPLREAKNQKPASGGAAGVQVSDSGEGKTPTLRDVTPEDLRETERLLELHRQAVEAKLVTTSEADRLKFVAGAAHAQAVGSKPCRLFAWMVWRGRWEFITQADEDAARTRLREQFRVPVPAVGPAAATPERRADTLSDDAVLARAVLQALQKAGYSGDPLPHVRRAKPEWTRERWDRAVAELEASRKRGAGQGAPSGVGSLLGRLGLGGGKAARGHASEAEE
jgi:hypothetical protein